MTRRKLNEKVFEGFVKCLCFCRPSRRSLIDHNMVFDGNPDLTHIWILHGYVQSLLITQTHTHTHTDTFVIRTPRASDAGVIIPLSANSSIQTIRRHSVPLLTLSFIRNNMADQSNIQCAASKSIRPFKSSEEYLYAMKEDLAEWLNGLYDLDITADTFMESLETGCALCRHGNNVNRAALEFLSQHPDSALLAPRRDVAFQSRNVVPGSFVARDNVSNFIGWCRHELRIKDVLMFETNDLVERCNEKNFVLCLLEVARRGAKFGMPAPMLVQLEQEIEEEIRDQENLQENADKPSSRTFNREKRNSDSEPELVNSWKQQKRVLCDMRNLDELVSVCEPL